MAKGFTQRYGLDYLETFSPFVKMATVRCLLSFAAHHHWPLHQLDINNAFLHGRVNEEVYMKAPEGLHNPEHLVCKLVKSLYGLKQASRQWFARLNEELHLLGYVQSKNDYSLFIQRKDNHVIIVALYVDDIIFTRSDESGITSFKQHLHHTFSIKDLGLLNFFLGIKISHLSHGILMTPKKFTRELY